MWKMLTGRAYREVTHWMGYSNGLILLRRMDAGIDVMSGLDGDFTATLTAAQ